MIGQKGDVAIIHIVVYWMYSDWLRKSNIHSVLHSSICRSLSRCILFTFIIRIIRHSYMATNLFLHIVQTAQFVVHLIVYSHSFFSNRVFFSFCCARCSFHFQFMILLLWFSHFMNPLLYKIVRRFYVYMFWFGLACVAIFFWFFFFIRLAIALPFVLDGTLL